MKIFDVDGVKLRLRYRRLGKLPQGYAKAGEYSENTIDIDPHQPRRSQQQTLLHEVLHHVWERAGLTRGYSVQAEENIITEVAIWLYLIYADVPELWREMFP